MVLSKDSCISDSYDHIVVGGGSSGCIVAARLSQNPACRVLMIEAGSADITRPAIDDPVRWTENYATDADWGYKTVPQSGLDGRTIAWERGRVLGGSSSINAMAWVWGHKADFDGWAAEGNPGWDFASLKPLFKRLETCTRTNDPDTRGINGPLELYSFSADSPLIAAYLTSCRQAGHPVVADVNGPIEEGAGPADMNVKDGRRLSVARAYIQPALERENLTVLTKTVVESLIFEGARCVGVCCRIDGRIRRIRSDHDIVLCAGCIETPRLLMISGIGNARHLKQLDIRVVADLPGVGENLHDHCQLRTFGAQIIETNSSPRLDAHLFIRSSDKLPSPDIDIALIQSGAVLPNAASEGGFALLAGLFQPRSRGRVALTSPDRRVPLHIDPNYLADPFDMDALCVAARESVELGMASVMAPWRVGDVYLPPLGKNELRDFIKRTVKSYHHPVGTCAMGRDVLAVVDSSLRVRGIENLRIADNSVMPNITTGHTLAPTLVIAEHAADMIAACGC